METAIIIISVVLLADTFCIYHLLRATARLIRVVSGEEDNTEG